MLLTNVFHINKDIFPPLSEKHTEVSLDFRQRGPGPGIIEIFHSLLHEQEFEIQHGAVCGNSRWNKNGQNSQGFSHKDGPIPKIKKGQNAI